MSDNKYRLVRPVINGRASQTWYIVWSEERRSRRISTKTIDKRIAERFLAQYQEAEAAPPEDFTIADLCDAYLKEREDSGKVAYPKAIANSLRHIKGHFGPLPPSLISRATVRSYLVARRKTGVLDSTIDKELRYLRQALKFGVREKWMVDEPKVETPGAGPARERVLTRVDFSSIFFEASPLHLRVWLGLAIDTLARGKHILALTWDRIDFERRIVWYVPHRPGAKKKTQPAPMSDRLHGLLVMAYAAAERDEETKALKCPRVVSWRGRPVKSVRKAYETAVRRAGIADAHKHDLRRSGASWAVQDGMSFDAVAALLGDSVEITRKHYAVFSPSYLREVVDSIAGGKTNARA